MSNINQTGVNRMKLFKILIGVVVSLIVLSYLNRQPETAPSPVTAMKAEAERFDRQAVEKATAAIKAEPKVKDLLYNGAAAVQWHVGVFTDGTPRHGYALYICEILRENLALERGENTRVRIIDIVAITRGADFREADLGTVTCETGQVFK